MGLSISNEILEINANVFNEIFNEFSEKYSRIGDPNNEIVGY